MVELYWPLVALVFVLLAHQTVNRFLDLLAEWRAPKKDPRNEPMPIDLVAHAKSFADAWAQDQVLEAMREDYAQSESWDLVRAKHGLGDNKT